MERGDPTRKRLGLALLVGAGLVFLWEMVNLVLSLFASHGAERGAVGSILLMILVLFLTVGLIGGGLVRELARERREAVEQFLSEEAPPAPGEEDDEREPGGGGR